MELRKCQLAMLSVVSARYSAYFYTTYTLVANCGVRHHSTEYFLCLAKSFRVRRYCQNRNCSAAVRGTFFIGGLFLFQEQFNSLKLLGIGLGIFAVLLILLGHFNESSGARSKSNFALMSVWFGYAAVDILLKYTSSLGLQFTLTLNLIFITAFVLSIIYLIFQKIQHGILKILLLG